MLILTIVSIGYAMDRSTKSLENEIHLSLLESTHEKKHGLENSLDDLFDMAYLLASDIYIVDYLKEISQTMKADPVKVKRIMDRLKVVHDNSNGLYENVYLMDMLGIVIADGVDGASMNIDLGESPQGFEDTDASDTASGEAAPSAEGEAGTEELYYVLAAKSPVTGKPVATVMGYILKRKPFWESWVYR